MVDRIDRDPHGGLILAAIAIGNRIPKAVAAAEPGRRGVGEGAVAVVHHAAPLGRAAVHPADAQGVTVRVAVVGQHVAGGHRGILVGGHGIIQGLRGPVLPHHGGLAVGVVAAVGITLRGADRCGVGLAARAVGPYGYSDAGGAAVGADTAQVTLHHLRSMAAARVIGDVAHAGGQGVGHGYRRCVAVAAVGNQQGVGDTVAEQHRIGIILFHQRQIHGGLQLEQVGSAGALLLALAAGIGPRRTHQDGGAAPVYRQGAAEFAAIPIVGIGHLSPLDPGTVAPGEHVEGVGGSIFGEAGGTDDRGVCIQIHIVAEIVTSLAVRGGQLGLLLPATPGADKDVGGAGFVPIVIVTIGAYYDGVPIHRHGSAKVVVRGPVTGQQHGIGAHVPPAAGGPAVHVRRSPGAILPEGARNDGGAIEIDHRPEGIESGQPGYV